MTSRPPQAPAPPRLSGSNASRQRPHPPVRPACRGRGSVIFGGAGRGIGTGGPEWRREDHHPPFPSAGSSSRPGEASKSAVWTWGVTRSGPRVRSLSCRTSPTCSTTSPSRSISGSPPGCTGPPAPTPGSPPCCRSLELSEKASALPAELSRGMRQKLVIACGLIHDPKALIFDEPLTGLGIRRRIRRMKQTIVDRARRGAAVLPVFPPAPSGRGDLHPRS